MDVFFSLQHLNIGKGRYISYPFDVEGLAGQDFHDLKVTATPAAGGSPLRFSVVARIDTPQEGLYFRHGGILQYVLRQLLSG